MFLFISKYPSQWHPIQMVKYLLLVLNMVLQARVVFYSTYLMNFKWLHKVELHLLILFYHDIFFFLATLAALL